MRKWLIVGGCVLLVGGGLWLALRSQKPAAPDATAAPARGAARDLSRRAYPRTPVTSPGAFGPRATGSDKGATVRVPPHPGKSLVPQFDPFLDQLAQAAQAGNLEKAAAENGIKLRGDQVRVVIRPTLGGGDKVREAVTAAGGEVVRTIERGASEPTMVVWVPAKALRTLAENESVRNLHRPVGIHANEALEQKAPQGGAPKPEPAPEPPPP
jgi:hypothetical protein